ncbi:hypothetical protein CDL15_Pgr027773 [Punica granatum]|nr:hypothetical protein CDL15_Pgr027773 [Punica granatum]PKI68392.1 hypothetical protein CRG98_011189 [Punica granatum]
MKINARDKNKKGNNYGDDPKVKKENENTKKNKKNNMLLITVTVLGSAGPIRFVANRDDPVYGVINAALKSYARAGRLPILGSDAASFLLYSTADFEAMSPMEVIGSSGGRNFVLCKKQIQPQATEGRAEKISHKATTTSRGGRWKASLNKSFLFVFWPRLKKCFGFKALTSH